MQTEHNSPPVEAQVFENWLAVLAEVGANGLTEPARIETLKARCALGLVTLDELRAETIRLLAGGSAPERALEVIAPAFQPGDMIELRALNPDTQQVRYLSARLDQRVKLLPFIRRHNGRSNLYVGVNPRRAEAAETDRAGTALDVLARRVVVLDFDYKDAPSVDPDWARTVKALRDLNPLLVLTTGNGVHVWLPIAEVNAARLPASVGLLSEAMARIGADNMADLPRIVRLPFTVNLPTESKLKRGAVVRLATPLRDSERSTSKPPSIEALCTALNDIAARLNLPGRGRAGTNDASARTGPDGEKKTPHPAPSPALLRMVVDAIPNDAGHFDARPDWIALCHPIKGAAIAGRCEAEGRAAWLSLSARWPKGGDPAEAERVWDTCRDPHTGWGTLKRLLERVNPAAYRRVRAEEARLMLAQEATQNARTFSSAAIAPIAPFNPKQLPPRPWLYGTTAIAGFLSLLVAAGGAGKSALAMAEAVAMATGREVLSGEKPVRPLCVWYHNAEDGMDEHKRRLAAAMLHHNVTHADLGNRLILTSGRDLSLRLARMGKDGPEIVPGVVDVIVETALAHKVDVIVLDPLGALHTLPENANEAINLLAGALREIAERTGAAIILLHHTSKAAAADMDTAGAGAARGASALVDAMRVARQVLRMTVQEAGRLGVSEDQRRHFLRIENGKANLAPAAEARWLRVVPVSLGNGSNEYPHGDNVATVERWIPPSAVPGTAAELARVQAAISAAVHPPRYDTRSHDWIGWLAARVLGLDAGEGTRAEDRDATQAANYARVRSMVDGWLRDGRLTRYEGRDPKSRKPVLFVGVGTPAVVSVSTGET